MLLLLFGLTNQGFSQSTDTPRIYKLSINDILNRKSTLASGVKETVLDAPASIVVVTAEDIRQRGYTSLDEVMSDLPDFDIVHLSGGMGHINAYQRGYRTVNTQRTLFMIDGIIINDLWSHIAALGPQYPLSSIERIEVLSGPASVVYGANAFLGIINIITKKAYVSGSSEEKTKASKNSLSLMGGSFDTGAIDGNIRGNLKGLTYAVSGRVYRGEAEDISDRWHFLSNKLYSDKDVWGPMLDFEARGKKMGQYRTLNEEYGILANVGYKGFKAGMIRWHRVNGYGKENVADRAQNNVAWNTTANQYYLRHDLDSDNISNNLILAYRGSRVWGAWAEAQPDWNPGMGRFSYLSYTQWNTVSSSFLLKENFNLKLNTRLQILTGLKYERKDLSKNYDVPGYWEGVYSSVNLVDSEGPYGFGGGITHSSDSSFIISPTPNKNMPAENRVATHDLGGHVLGVFNTGRFRFHVGIRYDHNSIYGHSVNPRISLIYKPGGQAAIKLIYGEAFHEPDPRSLWGGWNGRRANPDMKPEKVRNMELNLLYKTGNFLQEVIAYYALYNNVIKEEAENAGRRDITGVGYKLNYSFPNPIAHSAPVKGYLYYSFTKVISHIIYDYQAGAWIDGKATLGDIAPHKLNAGIHLPIRKFTLNLRTNMISERELYLSNPLREKNRKIAPHMIFSGNIAYNLKTVRLAVKVNNIFNHHYMMPGIRNANSGDDFSQRSQGYFNSLIPAPGRSFMINATLKF